MLIKICSKCGKEKDIIEFYKNKICKDGHIGTCKDCTKSYKKLHYKQNKDKYIQKAKTWAMDNP